MTEPAAPPRYAVTSTLTGEWTVTDSTSLQVVQTHPTAPLARRAAAVLNAPPTQASPVPPQ